MSWAAVGPARLCATSACELWWPDARATCRGARRSWRPPCPSMCVQASFQGVRGAPLRPVRRSGEGEGRSAAPRAFAVLACLLGVPPSAGATALAPVLPAMLQTFEPPARKSQRALCAGGGGPAGGARS